MLDEEPDVSKEPPQHRLHSVRQLEQAVARDLESLLNTRWEILEDVPEDFVEVRRSLVTYGVPDFTSLNLRDAREGADVRRALERAIATFEPRLERMRVTVEPGKAHDLRMRFRIDAVLRVEPAREPITFDAVLQLVTKDYTVQGQS